jgi:hypothetical protein
MGYIISYLPESTLLIYWDYSSIPQDDGSVGREKTLAETETFLSRRWKEPQFHFVHYIPLHPPASSSSYLRQAIPFLRSVFPPSKAKA